MAKVRKIFPKRGLVSIGRAAPRFDRFELLGSPQRRQTERAEALPHQQLPSNVAQFLVEITRSELARPALSFAQRQNRRFKNMRLFTLGLIFLGLTSCGGEETTDTPMTFTDASTAVDAGNAAMASGNYDGAANAFRYVVDNPPNDQIKVDYAMELCAALVSAKKETDAMEALTALATDHANLLSATKLQGLADRLLKPGAGASARVAEHVMNIAKDTLPEGELAKFDVDKVQKGVAALQSGDLNALAELGYVGD